MSIPIPSLDDRSFQDLVDAAKERIQLHTPEWTDHNVSDPGVALVELFAWMTESLTYRLNQVPDQLYLRFLELVGITPFAPRSATTDISFWLSKVDDRQHVVPLGTQVGTVKSTREGGVVFMTTADLFIRQPNLSAALVWDQGEGAFTDVSRDLSLPNRSVVCFPSMTAGDAVHFGFSESLAGNIIAIDVETSIHGIGVRPDEPPLAWEVSAKGVDGATAWLSAEVDRLGDQTSGLNQDGRIILYFPYSHERVLGRHNELFWLRARLTDGEPGYAQTPTITTVSFQSLGGRSPAEHGLPAPREVLGTSNGKPGQVFRVNNTPVLPRDADREYLEVTDASGNVERWTEVDTFAHSEGDSRAFTWDSGSGEIRFGPALRTNSGKIFSYGAIPPTDSEVAISSYRFGGGLAGNVPADSLVVLKTPVKFIQRATNRRAATRGRDGESVDAVKVRGPVRLVTGERAVTTQDFERLTLSFVPDVQRARCRPVREAGEPIRLFVIPAKRDIPTERLSLARDLLPTSELLEEIASKLERFRLLGAVVEVTPPAYTGVSVVARVTAEHGHEAGAIRTRCTYALYDYVNPLTGGPSGDGWPWGVGVTKEDIVKILARVPGVHSVDDVLLFAIRHDEVTGRVEREGAGLDHLVVPEFGMVFSARHEVVVDGQGSEPPNSEGQVPQKAGRPPLGHDVPQPQVGDDIDREQSAGGEVGGASFTETSLYYGSSGTDAPANGKDLLVAENLTRGRATDRESAEQWSQAGRFGDHWLAEQLPMVMARDPLLRRFLSGFQDVADTYRSYIDDLEHYSDPAVTPVDWVPWLGSWVDLAVDPAWSEARQRRYVREISPNFRWRGTRKGLLQFLTEYTEGDVSIFDPGHFRLIRTPGVPMEAGLPSTNGVVQIEVQRTGGKSIEQLRQLVSLQVPADVRFEIQPMRAGAAA